MQKHKFLLQILGLFIFLILFAIYGYFNNYFLESRNITFKDFNRQDSLVAILTIVPGTIFLFINQVINRISKSNKNFDFKICALYAIPALIILFLPDIYRYVLLAKFEPLALVLTFMYQNKSVGAILIGLGILHSFCLNNID